MAPPAFARTRGRAAHVMRRRTFIAIACLLVCAPLVARGASTKQLERVRGTVAYQLNAAAPATQIFGRIDLPDDSFAVTRESSRARVTLADSSSIEIGATTRVQLGAFNSAENAPTVISLQLGTLHFIVRHPAGGRANYRFVTPTSQIAVRGTEGYLVTGPTGTDFYCVDCQTGDVTVTVGTQSYALATGEQAIVIGTTPANANVDVVARPCANPLAIELSDDKIGAAIPADQRFDTTGAAGGDPLRNIQMPR
jgi:ferric-dicitrate binding protein FerR (iron transport regulator)